MTKPFQIDEFLARLRALSRRAAGASGTSRLVRRCYDRPFREIRDPRGTRVHLTPTEWRMLEFLARNPGALVTRQTLLQGDLGAPSVTDSGYLRLYMSQLRKKLEADPAHPNHLLTESAWATASSSTRAKRSSMAQRARETPVISAKSPNSSDVPRSPSALGTWGRIGHVVSSSSSSSAPNGDSTSPRHATTPSRIARPATTRAATESATTGRTGCRDQTQEHRSGQIDTEEQLLCIGTTLLDPSSRPYELVPGGQRHHDRLTQ